MEGEQRPNNGPPRIWGEGYEPGQICGLFLCTAIIWLMVLYLLYHINIFPRDIFWYFAIGSIGFFSAFVSVMCCWMIYDRRRALESHRRVIPSGRRTQLERPPIRVQRTPEPRERRNVDAATSSRARTLDAVHRPQNVQNPIMLFRNPLRHSIHILHDQQSTQEGSALSQEGRPGFLQASEESAASRMAVVALGVSDISSERTEKILTRLRARKLAEASNQPAVEEINPAVPGPSRLLSPERNVTSSKRITRSESRRQSDPKSPVPGRSTAASGQVRRRETGEKKSDLDSSDSD